MDPRSVTERECELWWAQIRTLAADAAFDMLMYLVLVPRALVEMMKRMMGCFFIYNTTDRKVDKTAYNFRAVLGTTKPIGFLRFFGGPAHKPPQVMEKVEKRTTGRIVADRGGIWAGIGNVHRVARRLDVRCTLQNV